MTTLDFGCSYQNPFARKARATSHLTKLHSSTVLTSCESRVCHHDNAPKSGREYSSCIEKNSSLVLTLRTAFAIPLVD